MPAIVERLEVRTLLSVVVEGVTRYASCSPYNGQIADPAPLVSESNGIRSFSTSTLVGYPYHSESWTDPSAIMLLGGVGLQLSLRNTGTQAETVTIDWGDPLASSTNPNTVDIAVPAGSTPTDIQLPHMYQATSQYGVNLRLGSQVIASVSIDVSHLMESPKGLFIRGTTGNDRIELAPGPAGSTVVTAWMAGGQRYSQQTDARPVYVEGLAGNDVILADPRFRRAIWADGGAGDDMVVGGAGNDHLLGGPGNDSLVGGDGNDQLVGAGGNDWIYGGRGNDSLSGGSGEDRLLGEAGNDSLIGDSDNDILSGGQGSDFLLGGTGSDTLAGGAGRNVLDGGYNNLLYSRLNPTIHRVQARWAHNDVSAAMSAVNASVTTAAFNLSNVLAQSNLPKDRAQVGPLDLGPTLAADGQPDRLDGRGGRNLILIDPGQVDQVIGPAGAQTVQTLTPAPGQVVNVSNLPDFATSSGVDIAGQSTRTTDILYRFQYDGLALLPRVMPTPVDPSNFVQVYGYAHPGTLQMLNVNTTETTTFWTDFNRPFLAYAASLDSVFLASTDPFDPMNILKPAGTKAILHDEFDYLRGTLTEIYPTGFTPYQYDAMYKALYL